MTSVRKDITVNITSISLLLYAISGERVNFVRRLAKQSYLDGFDQVGSAVGYLLGRLDKVPLGNWVGCLRGS